MSNPHKATRDLRLNLLCPLLVRFGDSLPVHPMTSQVPISYLLQAGFILALANLLGFLLGGFNRGNLLGPACEEQK